MKIYGDSDAAYQLALIAQQKKDKRLADIERKEKLVNLSTIGKSAYSIYDKSNKYKLESLLALKAPGPSGLDQNIFEIDPAYLEKNIFSRIFSPIGAKVRPVDISFEGSSHNMLDLAKGYADEGVVGFEGIDWENIEGPERFFGKESKFGSGNFFSKELIPKSYSGIGSTPLSGMTVGQGIAGLGTALSAYDLYKNWYDKSGVDRNLGMLTTATAAASLVPGPQQPIFATISLGSKLLDMILD